MGLFNEILSSRFNNLLRAFLPVDEQEGAPTLAPEIMPSIIVDDARRLDVQYLLKEKLCAGFGQSAAVAGQDSFCAVRNPAGSNVLATITGKVYIRGSAALMRVEWGIADLAGAAALTPQVLDPRWGITKQPTCQVTTGTLTVRPVFGGAFLMELANKTYGLTVEAVIPPGSAFYVRSQTNNAQLDAAFTWRERPASPGELV